MLKSTTRWIPLESKVASERPIPAALLLGVALCAISVGTLHAPAAAQTVTLPPGQSGVDLRDTPSQAADGEAGFEICFFGFCIGDDPEAGDNGRKGNDLTGVNSTSFITADAPAIRLLTIGQSGGDGGAAIVVGQPGRGGNGGDGGAITYSNSGFLTTTGAAGILAQSFGGRGGEGGSAFVVIGGGSAGGLGGVGGPVQLTNTGRIETFGDLSSGIRAESIGGRGGDGGDSIGIISSGGDGRYGSRGGAVSIISRGAIITHGNQSNGIQALSIGGGGGNGGDAAGLFTAGASGGQGVDGGTVRVEVSGTLSTDGDLSRGVMAQSIGGGGGNGGNALGAIALGGSGSVAGNGSSVEIVAGQGSVTTHGTAATGLFAASVGGGGGSGGSAGGLLSLGGTASSGGSSGNVTVISGIDITTAGARATAIEALSAGGGGGSGGDAIGAIAIGGDGSGAGSGGSVLVTSAGRLSTAGQSATAILAQSIGGGGGSGGDSGGLISIGARGDRGGSGGAVAVISTGEIRTVGHHSDGMFAQSVGGGGGRGGDSLGLLSVGGSSSAGGNGGAVTVASSGAISTTGDYSRPLFAQSVGGGGGASGGGLGLVAIGGSGAGGGDGGAVALDSSGLLHSAGRGSTGIVAQSIGGGGGDSRGAFGLLAIGGDAGAGGDGGVVTLHRSGGLLTDSADATGVLAQSVGGGGGNGGFAGAGGLFAAFAIGGRGGGGGDGGSVTLDIGPGSIATLGSRSIGAHGQSVGGGGGNGGGAFSISVGPFVDVAAVIGGTGGAAGSGGAVSLSNLSRTSTVGDGAHGLAAQSIGGGGGNGGFGISAAVVVASGGSLSVAVGGSGGAAGDGGDVAIASRADVATAGGDAAAIFAQSEGGGGGSGGFSIGGGGAFGAWAVPLSLAVGGIGSGGGSAGRVEVDSVGALTTQGDRSPGIRAQSVGGGGGVGGVSLSASLGVGLPTIPLAVSVGGAGAAGGSGGDVVVTGTQDIATLGIAAHGIDAQSVGGGGGSGGLGLALSAGIATGGTAVAAALAVGGNGGGGGDGGLVDVSVDGAIRTQGAQAIGAAASSVGGGGGSGGLSVSGALVHGQFAIAPSLSLGGGGGDGGDGGKVILRSAGEIASVGSGATGLLAQSTGGGGGRAGLTIAIADSILASTSYGLSFALGGSGGGGGDGDTVEVEASGTIDTEGDHASGILAESVGGGGGVGSFAFSQSFHLVPAPPGGGPAQGNSSIQMSIGGRGGAGGDGGAISIGSTAAITTAGEFSHGIEAQSIGGGGGSGGASGYSSDGDANIITALLSIGGRGGGGGRGASVVIANEGDIRTVGGSADGIHAESIGGGGGSGGRTSPDIFVDSGTTLLASIDNIQQASQVTATVRIGGSGGDGNVGGDVSVANLGTIDVGGISASGVFARSIGGGGGSGGLATAPIMGSTSQLSLDLTVGGEGGTGNHGGQVLVENEGSIVTRGASGYGILAESIGGGGGHGGAVMKIFSSYTQEAVNRFEWDGEVPDVAGTLQLTASIGGFAGAAGDGGDVKVDNVGAIIGLGMNSSGIAASSIGGGGGNGGAVQLVDYASKVDGQLKSVTDELDKIDKQLKELEDDINKGDFELYKRVNDIFGTNFDADDPIDIPALRRRVAKVRDAVDFKRNNLQIGNATNLSLALGGRGGASGDGGSVTVANSGSIHMTSEGSYGIFAQSVGGGGGSLPALYRVSSGLTQPKTGGGSGGAAAETAKTLSVYQTTPDPKIPDDEEPKPVNYDLALGGAGGAAGDGGDISITNSGIIVVDGRNSVGIFAQSIGGGGGNVGASPFSSVQRYGLTFKGLDQALLGGAAGDGGDIRIVNSGTIIVNGDDSYGILAQSIGGGGGTAFSIVPDQAFKVFQDETGKVRAQLLAITEKFLGFDLPKGVKDAAGKQAEISGLVKTVNSYLDKLDSYVGLNLGHIDLTGPVSRLDGITADLKRLDALLSTGDEASLKAFRQDIQSRLDALVNSQALPLFQGRGGDVEVISTGDIIVNGKNSIAYLAQSVGGKGGFFRQVDGTIIAGTAFGGGVAGSMEIAHEGDLIATGENGIAFYGQSAARDGRGDMSIDLAGDIFGGSGSGVAVVLDGGVSNRLTLHGRVAALSGEAIRGGDGDDAVTSFGILAGNVRLGLGRNSLTSRGSGSLVIAGETIDLNGGAFTSEGTLALGDRASLGQVNDFSSVQTTLVDGGFVQRATGHTLADISFGPYPSDRLNVTGTATMAGTVDVVLLRLEDDRPVTLVSTHGGASIEGLSVPDTLALDYGARVVGNDIQITLAPRFDAPLGRPNAKALGRFLNQTLSVGGATNLSPLLVYLGQLTDADAYTAAIDALSPEAYLTSLQIGKWAAEDAVTSVSSCTPAGAVVTTSEHGCAWLKARKGELDRDDTSESFGFEDEFEGATVGLLRKIGGSWSAGFSLGWENHSARDDRGTASFQGDLYSGAATLKWERGHGRVALALAGGAGDLRSERQIAVSGPGVAPQVGRANVSLTFLDAGIRASRYFSVGRAYLRPGVEADVSYVKLGAFEESGAGVLGSRSPGADHVSSSVRPFVEAGVDVELAGGFGLRPWMRLGGTWRVQSDFRLPVAFVGSIAAAGTYDQSIPLEGVSARVEAGFDLHRTSSFGFRVGYEGEFGKSFTRQAARLALSFEF
jgi:hypothetical protein